MSTTTNLKLFKHDNPTTNTNQFDVEKALNQNWDKLDANAGEVSKKIQALDIATNEKDTALETEIKALKAENAIFRSQIPSATVVEETVHLEDSSNMQCQIMPLGASIQEGTPSIESEAPIESVGDNINLWKMPESQTKNGVTLKVYNDGTYDLFGKATDNTEFIVIGDLLDFKKGAYYTFSTNHTGVRYQLALYNGNTWVATPINRTAEETTLEKTINPSISAEYTVVRLLMTISSGATLNISKGYLKLEKGNKKSAYSPYGQGSIEIYNTNKNLFDKDTVTNGYYSNAYGNLVASSTASTSDFIKVNVGESYYSNKTISIVYFDKNKQAVGILTSTFVGKFTPTYPYIKVNPYTSDVESLQIELGTVETEYVDHQIQTKALYTQQPLRRIGDVKDRFVKVDGVWYEEHPITTIVLDGTESITQNKEYNYFIIIKDITSLSLANDNINKAKSNYGIVTTESLANTSNNGRVSYGGASDGIGRVYIGAYDSGIDSVDKLKSKLSATPMIIQGIAVTPELIPCTPKQIEVLEGFNTYKNITNISSDSIGELEVFYYKDLETLLGGA